MAVLFRDKMESLDKEHGQEYFIDTPTRAKLVALARQLAPTSGYPRGFTNILGCVVIVGILHSCCWNSPFMEFSIHVHMHSASTRNGELMCAGPVSPLWRTGLRSPSLSLRLCGQMRPCISVCRSCGHLCTAHARTLHGTVRVRSMLGNWTQQPKALKYASLAEGIFHRQVCSITLSLL